MRGIEFDGNALRNTRRKCTITTGRVEHATGISSHGQHARNDLGWRKYLTEFTNI